MVRNFGLPMQKTLLSCLFLLLLLLSGLSLFGLSPVYGGEPKFKLPPPPDPTRHVISGRVLLPDGKALGDCVVRLWEASGEVSLETKTKSNGEFSIPHNNCGKLTLEVIPELDKGCSQSLVENLPGDETRKLIVRLRQGHLVTGRVVAEEAVNGVALAGLMRKKNATVLRGLKGLTIKVEPLDKGDDGRAHLYGSGGCETGRQGSFSMRLTAGKKKLTIYNELYPELVKAGSKEIIVDGDEHLGAIKLVPKKED